MIQVWTLPIRIFHFLLVISVITLFLTDDFKRIHEIAGFSVLFLIIFRLIYGLTTKNKYEKLSGFFHPIYDNFSFLISVFQMKEKRYLGHNPVASIVMILIFIISIMLVFSGAVGFAMKEEEGVFSFFILHNFELGKNILHLHHILSNILLTLVGFHLIGVLVSSFLTKENLAKTIFKNGLKRNS